ncbi:MAG: class I SAM-dependent methyltransferase [Solirubrobacteraceae bacterium]
MRARALAARGREAWGLRGLGWRVGRFRWRAHRLAERLDDDWALEAATNPEDLATLLRLARGRERIAELGTATGWTSISLALADPARRVVSCDPVVHLHRDRYLGLVPPAVRERIEFVREPGSEAAARLGPVEMLFIDSTHEREGTVAEFRAWRARLRPGAVVAFHDYGHPGFPGVHQAVADLGLEGEVQGGLFVWPAPREPAPG